MESMAFIFPGQGAQFPGMGRDLYAKYPEAVALFEVADKITGFSLSRLMFEGPAERLQETNITQPAIFVHSVVAFRCLGTHVKGSALGVAGHSLGEFSALVAAGALEFSDALKLVCKRAEAMQAACKANPSTMAAVIGMEEEKVQAICKDITKQALVVVANINCPGQLVLSGTYPGVSKAGELCRKAGARAVIDLAVGGAFHSPLMHAAQDRLAEAIAQAPFQPPTIPIYQNVDAKPSQDVSSVREKLTRQLTAPVRWHALIKQMQADGISSFIEFGPGKVLQGLVKKINRDLKAKGAEELMTD